MTETTDRVAHPDHPEGLSAVQEALAQQLHEIGSIRFGAFRLKLHDQHPEAPLSPVYIDLRRLRRAPEVKTATIDAYEELLGPLQFDLMADVPTAATPLVSSLSDRLGIGMITPRTDLKIHGTGAKIDGLLELDRGKRVVLVDDLVTAADSKLEAAELLIASGMEVEDIVVLIDREQGGKQQLEERGFRLHAALTMQQMLDFYLRTGIVDGQQYQDGMRGLERLNRFLGVC